MWSKNSITGDRVQHVNAQSVQNSGFTGLIRVELVSHQGLPSRAEEWSARIQEAASSQKVHKAPNSNTQRLFEIRQMPRLFDNCKFDAIAFDGTRHARRSWLLLQQSSWGQVDEPLPEFLCKPSVYKSQNTRNWKTTDMRKLKFAEIREMQQSINKACLHVDPKYCQKFLMFWMERLCRTKTSREHKLRFSSLSWEVNGTLISEKWMKWIKSSWWYLSSLSSIFFFTKEPQCEHSTFERFGQAVGKGFGVARSPA